MVEQVTIDVLLPILATIATALIPILMREAISYIKAKTNNEKVNAALDQLNDIVYTTVLELEQTVRKDLSDGKLTEEEKTEIKQLAISKIKGQLSGFATTQLQVVVQSLEDYISSKIEAFLIENKPIE